MPLDCGAYNHPDWGRQLVLYDGIQYGKITPSDIDGIVEYHNRIWCVYEVKAQGVELLRGQRTMLERFVHCMADANRHAIAIVCDHGVYDPQQPIYIASCAVRSIYNTENMTWRPPNYPTTLKQMSDAYIAHFSDDMWYKAEKGA